jgi:hypothetical protein
MLERSYSHARLWKKYPGLTYQQSEDFFKNTPRDSLSDLAIAVVNDPLRAIGITKEEWRLGTFFYRWRLRLYPPPGGSIGTPVGLMKFLIMLERGKL